MSTEMCDAEYAYIEGLGETAITCHHVALHKYVNKDHPEFSAIHRCINHPLNNPEWEEAAMLFGDVDFYRPFSGRYIRGIKFKTDSGEIVTQYMLDNLDDVE